MGGPLREGYCVIGGVVTQEVKSFFDSLIRKGIFVSRSKAIGFYLTELATKGEVKIDA